MVYSLFYRPCAGVEGPLFTYLGEILMGNETLSKLEAVVQKMLGTINELKKTNESLEAKIREKDSQIGEKDVKIVELEDKLAAVNSDQAEISSRVTSLISSIEEWEKREITDAEDDAELDEISEPAVEESERDASGPQLFDMGE